MFNISDTIAGRQSFACGYFLTKDYANALLYFQSIEVNIDKTPKNYSCF